MPDPGYCSAEELLQSIFNNGHEGFLLIDTTGVIRRAGGAVCKILSAGGEQMTGRAVDEVCRHQVRQSIDTVLKTGRPQLGKIDTLGGRSVLVDFLPLLRDRKPGGVIVLLRFLNPVRPVLQGERFLPSDGGGGGFYYTVDQIIGVSPQMLDLKETLLKVAPRNSNVLITGESGTGKELFAHALHAASLRRAGPFVKINCAAVPDTLLEAEFFGYEEGAFTGGRKGGRAGKLEMAHGGTVFLDEIADLSFVLQAKLLRFIQERELQKLGSTKTRIVDVRVVAATNVNLEQMVKYKKFREDLYYRLNVVNLVIPPLRERREDIPALVEGFIQKYNRLFKYQVSGVSPQVLQVFLRYSWPGNVRELENIIERAFNVIEGNVIHLRHLPAHLVALYEKGGHAPSEEVPDLDGPAGALMRGMNLSEALDQTEKMIILQALMYNRGNKARTAQMLGISRPGLYKKLVKYNLL